MLSSELANRFAQEFLDARTCSQQLPPVTSLIALDEHDAYEISRRIMIMRTERGERLVGHKIEFANRKVWPCFGKDQALHAPIWTPLFDTTVRNTNQNVAVQSLQGAVQPRIEPHIVLGLGVTPDPAADLGVIAECIDWMAHAIEIAVCPYPAWKFNAPDAIAAFGLHGTILIGEQHHLTKSAKKHLAVMLAAAKISLSCTAEESFTLHDAGYGGDVFGSPVHALLHLHRHLCAEPQFPALAAGEIVATGSWTNPFPVQQGQQWRTIFSGLDLQGMSVEFV